MVRLSHDGRKSGLALAVHTGGAAPPEARVAFSSKHMSMAFCLATTLADGSDLLAAKPDDVALYSWIDNYCRDKPLNALGEAVFALKNDLAARAR